MNAVPILRVNMSYAHAGEEDVVSAAASRDDFMHSLLCNRSISGI
jgi:hypothetical protein